MSYKASTASVCITPDESLWLAGYAARTEPARGKISDLFASALALEDETGERFVVASMDVIAITPIVAEPVVNAVGARHGLSRRQLLLSATHTHYGPEFRPDKQVFFNIPAEYAAKFPSIVQKLSAALTQAIDEAIARLEPVRLFLRETQAGFAHNRRRRGVVGGTPTTEDVIDHNVPVLDFVDAAGQRKAIVFGYACHNTTILSDDLRYCGDWAGFAKEQLEHVNPGTTALFLPGAGADQDPEPCGSIELSRQHGLEIAEAVQRSLDNEGTEIAGRLIVEWEEVSLPLEPITRDGLEKMLGADDPPQRVKAQFLLDLLDRGETLITSYPAPIQVLRLGNELLLVALSGEPVVDWAHKFKREFSERTMNNASPLVWVAGYCNDMFGYLPTRRVQAEGGYEGGRANFWSWIPAPFTDEVEDRITVAARRLVDRTAG